MLNLNNFRTLLIAGLVMTMAASCTRHTSGEKISSDLPEKWALLVLNIQRDFIQTDGRMPVDRDQVEGLLVSINELITQTDTSLVDIIYIGSEFSPDARLGNWFRNSAAVRGTHGAQRHPELLVIGDTYFPKDRPDAFSNADFDAHLRTRKISRLAFTGVFADQSILSTVKGALDRGYAATVLTDCIAAGNDRDLEKTRGKLEGLGVILKSSMDITKKWRRLTPPLPVPPAKEKPALPDPE